MTKIELTRKIASIASQVSNRRRKLSENAYTPDERAVAWADYDAKVRELGSLRLAK